ncbi:hypothetical protein R0J87_22905, partial [Halomonas sp. SIMBA_159]
MDGNWVQLELQDGKTGWVYAFYGELSDQPAQQASTTNEQVTVLTDGTNLRAQANTSSEVVTRANAGTQLSVAGKEGQ